MVDPFRVSSPTRAASQWCQSNQCTFVLKQLSEYLRLDDSRIIESEEVSPGVVLDFNADNQVVGVEILNLSKRSPNLNLRELQFQTDKS